MFTIANAASLDAATHYYYAKLAGEDYRTGLPSTPAVWGGRLAEALGAQGTVTRRAFAALANNLHPLTGERLSSRSRANRRAGYVIKASAPKSVSLLHEFLRCQGRDTEATAIGSAMQEAFAVTLRAIEQSMLARVHTTGHREFFRPTGNIAHVACVHYYASPVKGRIDPHVECVGFIFNMTRDRDKYKAGQFKWIMENRPYFQALFNDALVERLNGLGYETRREGLTFELKGITKTTRAKFSKRSARIAAHQKARDAASAHA
jgi:conjugative relaxase-like TrwC/TraI family protein